MAKAKTTPKSKAKAKTTPKSSKVVSKVAPKSKAKASVTTFQRRPCGPIKSSLNPDAFDKGELVTLAQELLELTKTEATKLTKPQLCEQLIAAASEEPAPKSKAKSKTVPKALVSKSKVKVAEPPKKAPPKKKKVGNCITRSGLTLQPHQVSIVNYLKTHRGVIIAWQPGTGKTLAAVAASQCFLDTNESGEVIVVTPLSLEENFKKEMEAYGIDRDDERYSFYTYQKFASTYRSKTCPANAMLIIDEAHNLRTDIARAKVAGRSRIAKAQEAEILSGQPPRPRETTIIADVALRCARVVDKIVLLTGTSVYNNPRDVINLVSMIKGEDPPLKKEFAAILKDRYLFRKYFECVFSFFDSPQTEDYPSIKESWQNIVMDKAYYQEYRKVEKAKSSLFVTNSPWAYLGGVRQASNALEACPKCEWVIKKVKEGGKTLIYSAFLTFGVMRIRELLSEAGIKYVEITGESSKQLRERAVKRYNSDAVNVMLITRAGGEGLDLKRTKNVIIFESTWNRENEEQIIRRAARYKSHEGLPKKDRIVYVYHLVMVKPQRRDLGDTKDSADVMLQRIARDKEIINEEFLAKLRPYGIENSKKCR